VFVEKISDSAFAGLIEHGKRIAARGSIELLEKIFGPGLLSTDTLDRLLGEDRLPGKADFIRRLTAGRAEVIAYERRLLAALEDAAAACVWLFLL
jgi:hypothetical protein